MSDNPDQIQTHLDGLGNEALVAAMEQAWADLTDAAKTQVNSEWHESCFAACVMYSMEMGKRGLKRNVK